MKLAGAEIEFITAAETTSHFPEGPVHAWPEDTDVYRERAKAHGYGDDVNLMSREHEITHHLLAHWLQLPRSPTMDGILNRPFFEKWEIEEAAILAIQAFARVMKIDLIELAKKYSED